MISDNFYNRQIKLGEIGSLGQDKLSNANVLVIGAGGLGSPLLNYIALAGVGNITIYDHDTIDESNLHRQILFSPSDIGKNKALIAKEKLSSLNPLISVTGIAKKFDGNIDISSYDIIIDCTDSLKTKFIAHDLCFKLKRKFIVASIHKFEGQIQSFDFSLKNTDAPCMRCLWNTIPNEAQVQTCEEVGILGAAVGVIGTMQALEVLKTILQIKRLTNEQNLIIDLLDFNSYKLKISKDSNCTLCSQSSFERIDSESELEISYEEVKRSDFIIVCLTPNTNATYDIHSSLENVLCDTAHLKKDQKVALICNKGITSLHATKLMRENQYLSAYSVAEGLSGILRKEQNP